jgi:hypothetical protein
MTHKYTRGLDHEPPNMIIIHRCGGYTRCLPADAYLDLFDSESDSSGDLGHSDPDAELIEVS